MIRVLRVVAGLAVVGALAACGVPSASTTAAMSSTTTSPPSTAATDATGLRDADRAPASDQSTYSTLYGQITSHCADGQAIAFSISTAVTVLNKSGAQTTNLAFMRGLLQQLGTATKVSCTDAIVSYQSQLHSSLGTTPSTPSVLLTTVPVGPSLPPSGCTGLKWPQPVPAGLVGANLSDASNALMCFTVSAIAPDGHDVMNDPANQAGQWVVTSVNPPAGTAVAANTTITMHVAAK
ncbi:hypothetical protein [Kutzneria buriramensis]|uniref:PASTA domain-containing protein n=1 Tax=Kutzneria buriramensis TaxID=1045776 RepID=A0A3E0HEM8_9PSEU|nr:hypothetical protein [Kutzneria buriramensis]REH43657.1 hypothetical protein BCF44_109200 [Kutzneria buriramensis]